MLVLAEERRETLSCLVNLLHQKYLLLPGAGGIKTGEQHREVVDLAVRLGMDTDILDLNKNTREDKEEQFRGEEAEVEEADMLTIISVTSVAHLPGFDNKELLSANDSPTKPPNYPKVPPEPTSLTNRLREFLPQSPKSADKFRGEKLLRKIIFCGNCQGCSVSEDCGKCGMCRDKPKFGGTGVKKQKCEQRWCELHPRLNRGPGSLRKEAVKCEDCGEEFFSGVFLRNHMKIQHDKYDADCSFYKIRDPSLTLKRADRDNKLKHLYDLMDKSHTSSEPQYEKLMDLSNTPKTNDHVKTPESQFNYKSVRTNRGINREYKDYCLDDSLEPPEKKMKATKSFPGGNSQCQ